MLRVMSRASQPGGGFRPTLPLLTRPPEGNLRGIDGFATIEGDDVYAMSRRRASCAPPRKLQRKLSDPVRIRSNPAEFLRSWNAEETDVFSFFETDLSRCLGKIRFQLDDESARDVRKDYGKTVCLATHSRKARRRHSLHLANSLPETADPLRHKLVQQFGLVDPVFTLKRCSSAVLPVESDRVSFSAPPPPTLIDKRVSFGADTLAEQIKAITVTLVLVNSCLDVPNKTPDLPEVLRASADPRALPEEGRPRVPAATHGLQHLQGLETRK
uniref:Uncharacterized protein n=1 Tax=Steinernema glaseri TaxID=37863 RepID=A0A1I7ZN15_9BILA